MVLNGHAIEVEEYFGINFIKTNKTLLLYFQLVGRKFLENVNYL